MASRWGCTSSPNPIFHFLPVLQALTMRQVFFSGPSFVVNEIGSRYKFYAALCSDAILVCYFVIRWRCVYLISNSVEIFFTHLSNFIWNYDFKIFKLKIVIRWLQYEILCYKNHLNWLSLVYSDCFALLLNYVKRPFVKTFMYFNAMDFRLISNIPTRPLVYFELVFYFPIQVSQIFMGYYGWDSIFMITLVCI